MLPFLKDNQDVAMSKPIERIHRSDKSDYDLLDAVAEDMMAAFKSGDVGRLKSALESYAEHLRDMDSVQDQQLMEGT